MKKHLMMAIMLIAALCRIAVAQTFPWQDTLKPLDQRVEWLIQNLTLDEKLSLMVHQNPAIPRVGLPAYSWWNEALHGVGRAGYATVYPMPIALAATFDPQLVRNVFNNVALEARLKYREAQDTGGTGDYTGLTFFTPNINIFRDPRWGRGMETYGEDPYLTAMMGLACVNGLQHAYDHHDGPTGLSAAACLKHFAVHSGPEGVRHEFDSRVSDRDLRTTYLPAFEYIIKNSDVQQVMCGYNRLNGEPCCTNRRLFDILRNEWHYDGILVTDCWALNDAYERDTVIPRHRTHATAALAYGDAFGSEVDLECGSGRPALREAMQQGLVPESKVDEHVRRILTTRLRATEQSSRSAIAAAEPPDVAPASMVLLKNDGVLPLNEGEHLRLEGVRPGPDVEVAAQPRVQPQPVLVVRLDPVDPPVLPHEEGDGTAHLVVVLDVEQFSVFVGGHTDGHILHHFLSCHQNLAGNVVGSGIATDAGRHHVNHITVGGSVADSVLGLYIHSDLRLSRQCHGGIGYIHFLHAFFKGGEYFQLSLCDRQGHQGKAD